MGDQAQFFIEANVLKHMSTNQQRGLLKKLDGYWVRNGDEDTGSMVLQLQLDQQRGWCVQHKLYHDTIAGYQTFKEPYSSCPPPPRYPTPTMLQGGNGPGEGPGEGEGKGPGDEGDGEGQGQGTEGEHGEPLDAKTQVRIDEFFEGDKDGKAGQAKKEAQKDGTLPKDMKQKGKNETLEKDKQKQCPVYHGQFKCTLKAGHEGDHIAHWSDGTKAKRWQGNKADKDRMAGEGEEICQHRLTSSHVCTKPKGHSGDHVAHVGKPGSEKEVAREPQEQKKPKQWKLKLFNRCPDCRIDTLNFRWQTTVEPKDETAKLLYTENSCGCELLKEIGF